MSVPLRYALFWGLLLLSAASAGAYALQRSGQPYAETICNDAAHGGQSAVILCEDFDYPSNFNCIPGNPGTNTWTNPGLTSVTYSDCAARDFPLLSTITGTGSQTLPAGTPNPTGNAVYRARLGIDPAANSLSGCILGDCDRTTADTPTTYANGLTAGQTIYLRYQMYRPAGFPFAQVLDNKVFFLYPNTYSSKPAANVDAGHTYTTTTFCSPNNWSDAFVFRVGSNSQSFKGYPADEGVSPAHQEYCAGTGAPNGSEGDGTVAVTTVGIGASTQAPNPGTLYRLQLNMWHTFEWRYTLASAGSSTGTIEAWVDGVKVYGNSDLETCGSYGASEGNCYAIHELQLLNSWHNPNNTTDYNGAQSANCGGGASFCYSLIDNLVISKAPIGVPSVSGDTLAPAAPTRLRVRRP